MQVLLLAAVAAPPPPLLLLVLLLLRVCRAHDPSTRPQLLPAPASLLLLLAAGLTAVRVHSQGREVCLSLGVTTAASAAECRRAVVQSRAKETAVRGVMVGNGQTQLRL
jgi:hypothetical protein